MFHRLMFSFSKPPTALAGTLRGWCSAAAGERESIQLLDTVAARAAVPTERSLDEFLRERAANLKRWQQRRY